MSEKFASRVGAFASATMVSRMLGYVRDAMVAHVFGGAGVTDAFYAAFRIPNLLRRFFGEGSFTAAFVPVFTDVLAKGDEREARRFFNSVFTGLSLLLALIVGLGILFAPWVARVAAWGFSRDPGQIALTTDLVRLTFPFLLFVCLAALASGTLNARGRFFVPALAPAGLSVAEIAFMLFLASRFEDPVYGLAVSAAAGGFLHWAFQLPSLKREGYLPAPAAPRRSDTTRILSLMAPTVIGLSSDQINAYVDTLCASFLATGSVTALYNSNRVMQLPLALFGIAVSSVALPALSAASARKDEKDYKETLSFALRVANFLIIPAAIGLIVIGRPIVELLFEHGRFTGRETNLTTAALAPFCLGLPAYASTKILASAFFAFKDTRTPVRASVWSMVVNVALSLALMWRWGVAGLAAATAAAAWTNSAILFFFLRRHVGLLGGRAILRSAAGVLAASAPMAAAAWLLANRLPGPVLVRVAAGVGGGFLVFLAAASAIRLEERRHLKTWLGRSHEA